jgi:hypothetical protein
MPYKATGRPTGRPLGRKSIATTERERIETEAKASVFADLTEEQIQAITPREMFRSTGRHSLSGHSVHSQVC